MKKIQNCRIFSCMNLKNKRQKLSSVLLLSTAMSSAIRFMAPVQSSIVVSQFPNDAPAITIGTHDGSFHCDEVFTKIVYSKLFVFFLFNSFTPAFY